MSVFITLSTTNNPNLGEIIQFAETAKALGLDPKSLLVATREVGSSRKLSVVVPVEHFPVISDDDS